MSKQGQITKEQETRNASTTTDALRASFESAQSADVVVAEVEKIKRITLKYNSCCGRGCRYIDLRVEVPIESKYDDGDLITSNELEKGQRSGNIKLLG